MPTTPSRAVARASFLALAFALPLGVSAVAHADVVCGDRVCPQNYECKDFPAACPAVDCVGKDCPTSTCNTTVQECSPLPCTSDAECADGMACFTDGTQSGCVPQYVLPCQADADCGVGFNCVEEQDCACAGTGSSGSSSGSAGSSGATPSSPPDGGSADKPAPDADGGAADPAPPADELPVPPDSGTCTCTPSGSKVCNVRVLACSVDEGCPTSWTCGANPNGVCFANSDGTTGCTADPPMICLPPYYDLGFGTGASKGEDGGTTVGGGTAGSPSTGMPTDLPATDPGSAGSSHGSSNAAANDSSDSGGCAVGHARGNLGATFGFAALAFFGLLGARRRRGR